MCLIVDVDIDVPVTRARASAILGPTQRNASLELKTFGVCVRGHAVYSGPRAERFCCLCMQLW